MVLVNFLMVDALLNDKICFWYTGHTVPFLHIWDGRYAGLTETLCDVSLEAYLVRKYTFFANPT